MSRRGSWRKRLPDLARRLNAHQRQENKKAFGRVCLACSRKDYEVSFAIGLPFCKACYERGRRNGFCQKCGAARYRTSGHGAVMTSACRCPTTDAPEDWEAIPCAPALAFLGGSCSCPLPGPCYCGASIE